MRPATSLFLKRFFNDMSTRDMGPGFIPTGMNGEEVALRKLASVHRGQPSLLLAPPQKSFGSFGMFPGTSKSPAETPAFKPDNKNRFGK